jgi:hypothetical protein
MFCSECGANADGKFCWSCGKPLRQQAASDVPTLPVDWTKGTDYQTLIQVPAVRERIARHAARAKKRMSGEQFLDVCDKLVSPLAGGVSLSAIAALTQPLTERIGIKTGKSRTERFREQPGTMLVAVLCSLAQNGQELRNVEQAESGCILEANLPSDLWSFAGDLVVAVRAESAGTSIEAAATIKGQYYDWGKSRRAIDQLFSDVTSLARAA